MAKKDKIMTKYNTARLIRDTRDASKDRFIPRELARKLYEEGKLSIDLTNSKPDEVIYIELEGDRKQK